MIRTAILFIALFILNFFWLPPIISEYKYALQDTQVVLSIKQNKTDGTISVYREGKLILTQNAGPDFRPYIHPIIPPDGKGVLTEFSPPHHKHQTGLYWGFTRLNGRDFFHSPGNGYWKRVSAYVIQEKGAEVKWQTVYNLLDEKGYTLLTETQNWLMREEEQ